MERPAGPRPPPQGGDRNRAFESIFGRPSAVHHVPTQAQPHHLQAPASQYVGRTPSPSGYSQRSLATQYDPRVSYGATPQAYQQPYRGSPPGTLYEQGPYDDADTMYAASQYRAASSSVSIASRPESYYPQSLAPEPDQFYAQNQYAGPGVTAAQAYQQQVYQQTAPGHHTLPAGAAPPQLHRGSSLGPSGRSNNPTASRSIGANSVRTHYTPSGFLPPPLERGDGSLGLDDFEPARVYVRYTAGLHN